MPDKPSENEKLIVLLEEMMKVITESCTEELIGRRGFPAEKVLPWMAAMLMKYGITGLNVSVQQGIEQEIGEGIEAILEDCDYIVKSIQPDDQAQVH